MMPIRNLSEPLTGATAPGTIVVQSANAVADENLGEHLFLKVWPILRIWLINNREAGYRAWHARRFLRIWFLAWARVAWVLPPPLVPSSSDSEYFGSDTEAD